MYQNLPEICYTCYDYTINVIFVPGSSRDFLCNWKTDKFMFGLFFITDFGKV